MPNLAEFETAYESGKIEAVSYVGGKEVSRDLLCTAGQPAQIKLSCCKNALTPDGHDAAFVMIDILDDKGQTRLTISAQGFEDKTIILD